MEIRAAQREAWANKLNKGFNTENVPLEFCLLSGEVAEAFGAWRKGQEDLGEELADVAIYLLGLAQMTGVDLGSQMARKLAENAARTYRPLANGTLVLAAYLSAHRTMINGERSLRGFGCHGA